MTELGSAMLTLTLFGFVLIMLVSLGCRMVDWLWKRVDLQEQVSKGNIAAGIVMASIVLGLCYAAAQLMAAIL